MDTLEIEYGSVRDRQRVERDGTVIDEKVATFWIGRKHGPFTEVWPRAEFSVSALRERAERMRDELARLKG